MHTVQVNIKTIILFAYTNEFILYLPGMKTSDSKYCKCLYFASGALARKMERLAIESWKKAKSLGGEVVKLDKKISEGLGK